jgi:hypothetical protein
MAQLKLRQFIAVVTGVQSALWTPVCLMFNWKQIQSLFFANETFFLARVIGILRFAQNDMAVFSIEHLCNLTLSNYSGDLSKDGCQ